jgi:hypothetical protein
MALVEGCGLASTDGGAIIGTRRPTVYATLTEVEFLPGRHDAATQMLNDDLIPRVKGAPGFVRGTWVGDDSTGHGLIVFQTEDQARQAIQALESIEMPDLRVTHNGVYHVDGEA